MASVGIIAEYNPFHNGHLYQIQEIKKKYKDATIIVAMSGNFTQRGEIAILDKWTRARLAIESGADLVIEIPYAFVVQSADYFAYAGVMLLEKLKVDKLIFGSESNNIEDLIELANAQATNKDFDKLVKIYCKLGNNYPTSLSLALKDITGKIINAPNDILGITYIKTIKKYNLKIKPETMKRTNNYHSETLEDVISSATAIRKNIDDMTSIKDQVPKNTYQALQENTIKKQDDFYTYLKYKIITEKDLTKYHLVNIDLEKKLQKYIITENTSEDLIKKVKGKHETYSKISRALLNILCNYTKEEAKANQEITYIRLLGFNEKGRSYLNKHKKEITLPIISKIEREKPPLLELELKTSKIATLPYPNQLEEFKKEYKENLFYKEK